MLKIGKYVNTHGIKGEIRILSNFSRKDLVFKPGFKLYIDNNEYVISTYRKHKEYDMVTFKDVNSINDIEYLKGNNVYIKREDINTFIDEDLYEYKISINNKLYEIEEILENKSHKIIRINNKLIPYVDEFIVKKDDESKIIYMTYNGEDL